MTLSHKDLDAIVEKQRKDFIADYKKLVEIPSVSPDPAHKKDVEKVCEMAAEYIQQAGGTAEIISSKGNPAVFGRFEVDPNAPTVALYAHLDVQPATKGEGGWTRDPFDFVEEKGRFYSRGTTDDKGPALTAFWAAKIAKDMNIPLNIEFIFETEEEIGSPSFPEIIEKIKPKMKASSVIISDTIWIAQGKPAITIGLRGLCGLMVKLRTSSKDTHSGMTGGPARNPVGELCQVIAKCYDAKTGEITIPGFAETWTPPTQEQINEFVEAGFDIPKFKAAHGLEKLRYDDPGVVASKIYASPTFEVHGIAGGYQGPGIKTVVPPEAEAKISCRLIPGQDPDQVFELVQKYIKELCPDCEIEKENVLKPYGAKVDRKYIEAVKDSIEFGFGKRPAEMVEGGSIGAAVTMDEMLNIPVVFMGLSLPTDSYHGPDESFAWEQVSGGVRSFVKYFDLLSKM